MLRRWKAKRCWDNSEINNCRKQLPSPGLGEPQERVDVTRTQECGGGAPLKLVLRLLQETPQCQCLELSREHWQLVLRHLRGGPTSDLWWSTTYLMLRLLVLLQGVQMAWPLLVGYRPQVEAKRQSFLSSSHLPVSTGFKVRLFNLYVVKPINFIFLWICLWFYA